MGVLIRQEDPSAAVSVGRPRVGGKFLWQGARKLFLHGVTYGTFSPNSDGEPFPERAVVRSDFSAMRMHGINSVRTYTPAPKWMLDEAERNGLLVLCGLPWEQHIAFLDGSHRPGEIESRVREMVRGVAAHPALLGFTVGNEIPGDVVRWSGRRRVERFLERLVAAVKDEDPGALVTYVNFPTTEYLELPFVDFLSFNVYLEERGRLEKYLARLQNLAQDVPLVMAEIGLDSRRNGLQRQAESLAWQIDSVFRSGSAGCYVFAWTDEWSRGGVAVQDWDFGLVGRTRSPKPALSSVRAAFGQAPFSEGNSWPFVSVAICTHNGSRTIVDTLDGVQDLDYPDFECIVVDDGSNDDTGRIAQDYPVRLITTENRGLSSARNTAWQAAGGSIVAYTDDDARPDPHWLKYLVTALERESAAGVGGPNIAPPGDGLIAECVANAPGGPAHVLLDDVMAEHVPGCNMAFRRDVLEQLGGFDPRFRAAGDDVDFCWRVYDAGHRIVFSPAAMVWHHRRNEVGTYWKQQQGYGKAEALLEEKWPEKYNFTGHVRWRGRIYGPGLVEAIRFFPERIYHGTWGLAPFQRLYRREPGLAGIPTMPEWYLLAPPFIGLGLLGMSWPPLAWAWVLVVLVIAVPVAQAIAGGARARFRTRSRSPLETLSRRALTAWLHLIQPIARLKGRLQHGLSPWRRGRAIGLARPIPRKHQVWSEVWTSPGHWLSRLEADIRAQGASTRRGGAFDRWDLHVSVQQLAGARLVSMTEEHGEGKQLWRVKAFPWIRPTVGLTALVLVGLSWFAFAEGGGIAGWMLLVSAVAMVVASGLGVGRAMAHIDEAIRSGEPE